MRGHGAGAPLLDGLAYRGQRAAVQPGAVGEIGCAHGRVAVRVRTVARGAQLLELVVPGVHVTRLELASTQAHHVTEYVFDPARTQRLAPRGHDSITPAANGRDQRVGIAAVQPVLVGEVREAGRSTAVGTVAGGAIVEEQVAADVERRAVLRQFHHASGA